MSALAVTNLRVEYLTAPLGIDEQSPRLSWQLECDRRGARQVAYRVRVASSIEALLRGVGDRWDSARVESEESTHVVYSGAPLRSRDVCHWAVEVWDETGASVSAPPSRWTMGLLARSDWTARWITADSAIISRDPVAIAPTPTAPGTPACFRKVFEVGADIRGATIYASARGIFELRINGDRVGEDLFAPEWTDYRKRIHYRTYDVTRLLQRGTNVVGATLGDGWWSGYLGWHDQRGRYGSLDNSLVVQLEIELADGARLVVGTDASWICNTGPIISADFQMGEVYDARRERPAWDRVAGSSSDTVLDQWLPARELAPPAAVLVAQRSEPVRLIETLSPTLCVELGRGVLLYDLGQNISGWVRFELTNAPAGTRVTIRHGERLNPDGTLYTANLRRAKATEVYICRGSAHSPERGPIEGEQYEPHFTFHGFQYFEITSDPPLPAGAIAAVGCVIHSATPPAGHFECSNADVNRLWLNGLWSQRDNFLSVPTDCPQRDERLGWMGDAQVFLRTASYNTDVAAFFTKWMIDVEDAQTPAGVFSDIAPRLPEGADPMALGTLEGAAGWADAGIIVPWTLWRVYGDRRIIERHWGAMKAWLDWIERTNPRGIRENELGANYGDWLCIPTDTSFRTHSPMKTLLATAYWADDAAKMARMARTIGRYADARRFDATFDRVRAAFQKEWVRADGQLVVETQTAYLVALAFNLLPEAARARAAERLVENIRALGWHLSTGFIGISHLNPTLTLTGHVDVAYKLLLQDTFPSWLYPVKHGATTIWERWNGWTHEAGFFDPQMNSFNHYSLGSVGEWLFRHVAGIDADPGVPGFQRFVLRPCIGGGLSFARATFRTMHGEIASEWHRDGDRLTWTVRIPPNTAAHAFIPAARGTKVSTDGLLTVGRDDGCIAVEAPAGTYTFKSVCGKMGS